MSAVFHGLLNCSTQASFFYPLYQDPFRGYSEHNTIVPPERKQASETPTSNMPHPHSIHSSSSSFFVQTSDEDQQRLKLFLLKDLPVRPLILLTIHFNRLVPAPLVLDERLVLLLARVELREGIALVVRGDVEGGLLLLAADDECPLDDGFVGFAVDRSAAEDVFAGAFEAGEEAT